MKKITDLKCRRSILLFLFAGLLSLAASAGPGDTTWVTVFNLKKLDHYGNYDTVAAFPPAKKYRKIRMHYILGRYACPGTPQYCGSWDYTTQILVRPKNMDSVEIAKVITPYASDWLSKNITHDYVVDATDYTNTLKDSVAMRFVYEGYSWGFTITLKFELIEGNPPMDVISVRNLYRGYFPYGNASNPIENHLTAKSFSYSSSVGRVYVKNSISGHGSDNTGCAEFCNKYYTLKVDNSQVAQRQLWRSDCGRNPVSPQTGTWIYSRGNWCPGAIVTPIYHDISMFTLQDVPFTVDIDMQPYTTASPSGGYNYQSQVISYGFENYTTDVSLEEIIAPRLDESFFISNSACMNPVVRIKNTGYDSIKTVAFEYGLRGRVPDTYTWTGSLGFLQETNVTFPSSTALMSQPTTHHFDVKVTSVNFMNGDEYADNNIYSSRTSTIATLPGQFVVRTRTNGSTKPASNKSQTTWALIKQDGDTVAAQTSMNINTSARDSLYNLADGCYLFRIEDSGCDGFSWWANPSAGHGTINIHLPANDTIILHEFKGDIGCGSDHYFYVGTPPPPPPLIDYTAVKEQGPAATVHLFPNPANTSVYLRLNGAMAADCAYMITDISGRLIADKNFTRGRVPEEINTSQLENGIYFLTVTAGTSVAATRKMVVQH